jgi:signal transduction histidine kinase
MRASRSIKNSVLIIIGIGLIATIFTLLVLTDYFILGQFKEIEIEEAKEDMDRVVNLINLEVQSLDHLCLELAMSEDTQQFIRNPTNEYIKNHLNDLVFEMSRVNFISFLNSEKEVIFWKDYPHGYTGNLLDSVIKLNPNTEGLFVDGDRIYLVSYKEVPESGYLIMAKLLDVNSIAISENLVNIEILKEYDLDINFQNDLKKDGVFRGSVLVKPLSDEIIAGYVPITTLNEKIVLKIEMDRNIYLGAKIAVLTFVMMFISIGIIATLFAVAHLSRNLKRIEKLTLEVDKITEEENFERRVSIEGDDEISLLAENINRMLERLSRTTKKLAETTNTLKLMNKILRHDILNNLSIISASLDLIETGEKEFLDSSRIATERSVELINEMRQLENSLSEGELKQVDVRETVEKVAKGIDVDVKIEGEGKVLGDEALASVIDNIMKNAVRHGGCSKIDVKIEDMGDTCLISIADDGKGIPDEIKGKVFEESFTYGNTGGTGLGLFIAKKVIERYGGRIWVENNKPKGTIFKIELRKQPRD